jgi:hypothetical protein
MSLDEKNSSLPSYEESINGTWPTSRSADSLLQNTSSLSRGQRILDNLTLVRSRHIRTVVDTHIIALIEQQAHHGIAHTTIAMIPSDVPLPAPPVEKSEFSFDTGDEKKLEVIGFSSDDEPQIVRLEGQMNRAEFWRSQSIITELERVLKECLSAKPHLRPLDPKQVQPRVTQTKQKRSFFGRMADAMNQEQRSPSESLEVDDSEIDHIGQMVARVRLDDICLRTVNEFGLYDTMSRQCVIIRVDARC